MKKAILTFSTLLLMAFMFQANAQVSQMLGKWQTIDDETGEAKSIVEIYKKGDKYFGKIVDLLTKPDDTKCTECTGDLKDKPIVGMNIVTNMKADGDELEDGKIMDPANGEYYYCSIEFDGNNKDKLKVRGSLDSWGVAGRTQIWHRVKK